MSLLDALPNASASTAPAARAAASARTPGAVDIAATAVDLQATLLSQAHLADAGAAWVHQLAAAFGFERVALGLRHHGERRAVAHNGGAPIAPATPAFERLRRAWDEALDQAATIALPDPRPQAHPRITLAHGRLRATPAGAVASVPLVAAGVAIGAVTVERPHGPITAAELEALEHLACLAAPVLNLMRLNERGPTERLRDAWAEMRAKPAHRGWRRAALAGGGVLALSLLWPIDWRIGGHARLEGAVQRLLVAPADGFLREVHARPGEAVKAGQVLVELADQDLQLEQQRWQSALSQYENAVAAANAHADRTQQVIQQSRAAEAQAQLDLVQMKLERGRIEAPFDGIVVQGDLSQQLGAPISQGAELMTVAPLGAFRVIVEVDERDIAHVAPGQAGTLALSALPWDRWPLRVTRLTPMAAAVEGRNVFEVEATLLAPSVGLRPGLQGSAQIVVGRQGWLVSATRRLVESARVALWGWWGWAG